MTERCSVAIVGSGFSGSVLARVLAVQGHRVVLIERGTHPRFAIGESTTPLANLALERLSRRYGLADCYDLAAHGRWLERYPDVMRGLKRGFTFYRHHRGEPFADRGLDSERLLVAASPSDAIADTHWLRADVDHHFVREAIAAGVEYQDHVELKGADIGARGVRLSGRRNGNDVAYQVDFLIDASGPGGFLARQLAIPSGLARTRTRSALVFSHFKDVRLMNEVLPGLPPGPYPDDWAAMHHLIDGGWMYSLRFDNGVVSAGFALSPRGLAAVTPSRSPDARQLWDTLLKRYPTIRAAFEAATPVMPFGFRSRIQHRLTRAAGPRWVLMPHAYAFVDPLFSTGIAWSFRAIERLALCFEAGLPKPNDLKRYDQMLAAEADQIDVLVAGAYEAMEQFNLFAAQALIYFAAVSFAEVRQRLVENSPWSGFLGVGDPLLGPLPRESLRRLRRRGFERWVAEAIAPRNIAGFADPAAHNLYPVDLDVLVDRRALLGLSREEIIAALPALRGVAPALTDEARVVLP
ncbi:MAG TPA: FAD-dependent oxidoreductase [Gemmatimonadales bacterium]|nr:FAD-dependent oxidoreductase [Gemmatimonadales bacterium]